MKLKDLRQKYNGLLEKLIRLFTLSGVMFTVTACYGVAPFDTEEKDIVDVKGQIMDEDNLPLESIQVVIQSGHEGHQHSDTVYTSSRVTTVRGIWAIAYSYPMTSPSSLVTLRMCMRLIQCVFLQTKSRMNEWKM